MKADGFFKFFRSCLISEKVSTPCIFTTLTRSGTVYPERQGRRHHEVLTDIKRCLVRSEFCIGLNIACFRLNLWSLCLDNKRGGKKKKKKPTEWFLREREKNMLRTESIPVVKERPPCLFYSGGKCSKVCLPLIDYIL